MAYRDDTSAARARLASLELELVERRTSRRELFALRIALRGEVQRLSNALVWYTNGAFFGFNVLHDGDELAPAVLRVRRPADVIDGGASLVALDASDALARAEVLSRTLALADPALDRLTGDVERLRDQWTQQRALVEQLAAKYPDHPPPEEYSPSRKLALTWVGASMGGVAMLVAVVLFALGH